MHWTARLVMVLMGGVCFQALAQSAAGLSSLPRDAQGPISAALGKDDAGYWVLPSAAGFRGENARQAIVAEFGQGAELRSHGLRWGWRCNAVNTATTCVR